MTRAIVKPVEIELGGKSYELRLDFSAMSDFEDETGKSVLKFIAPIFETLRESLQSVSAGGDNLSAGINVVGELIARDAINARDLRALLWACLGGPDSSLTLRQAGRLVNAGNVAEIGTKLFEAIREALPKSEQADGEPDSGNAENLQRG
jgi:hypothetical protein